MAFSDWEVFTTNGTVALDTITVIAGTASLLLRGHETLAAVTNLLPAEAGPLDEGGLTVGKLRTLLHTVAMPGSARYVGLVAMQAARDLRATGAAYFCGFDGALLVLRRVTGGVPGLSGGTLLGSVSYPLVEGATVAVELQWIADPVDLQGVDLVVRAGTSFGTMTDRIHVIDLLTSGALSTSVGQGLCLGDPSNTDCEFRLDSTTLYGA